MKRVFVGLCMWIAAFQSVIASAAEAIKAANKVAATLEDKPRIARASGFPPLPPPALTSLPPVPHSRSIANLR